LIFLIFFFGLFQKWIIIFVFENIKLITILSSILKREVIKTDFEPKYEQILNLVERQIDEGKQIYDDAQSELRQTCAFQPRHQRNMPHVSGCIKWCRELVKKIQKPYEMFTVTISGHTMFKTERMERINKKYEQLIDLLEKFSMNTYRDWSASVGVITKSNLDKMLIRRQGAMFYTNFDQQVYFRTFYSY